MKRTTKKARISQLKHGDIFFMDGNQYTYVGIEKKRVYPHIWYIVEDFFSRKQINVPDSAVQKIIVK